MISRISSYSPRTILFIFFVVGFVTYANGLSGPFMMDDRSMFGSWLKDKSILSQFVPYKAQDTSVDGPSRGEAYYRPFHHASLIIFYRLFGDHFFLYHLLNLSLFVFAAFFIYRLMLLVFADPVLGFLTGLFYLAHPINGIFINWITASAFTTEVIFMVLVLIFLMREKLSYLASMGCFVLAVLSHESAMFLPFFAFVLVWITGNKNINQAIKKTAPFFIVVIFYFLFRLVYASFQDTLFDKYARFHMNFGEYLASLSKVFLWYISRLFYLQGIVVIWTIPVVRSFIGWWVMVFFAALALWGVLIYFYRNNKPALLGLLWFAIGFLPLPLLCLLQPMHGPMIEPHWFAFSSIGFFLFLAVIVKDIFRNVNERIVTAGIAALLSIWIITGWVYNYIWSDERRYCQYWLSQAPTFTSAAYHLAKVYEVVDGNLVEAKKYYREALVNDYFRPEIYPHLGWIAMMQGDWPEAYRNFYKTYQLNPHSWEALNNLGVAAYGENNYQEALKDFRLALELNPQAEVVQRHILKTLQKLNN